MGCIYKITNIINNKLYIGYTTATLKERMRRHKNDDINHNTLLGRAIKKYGWENFKYEVVVYEDDKEKLLELEQYYIKYFNSKMPNGYNMTDGGEKLYRENNPFYGHRHNEKTKEKISKIASLRTGEKNPFYNHHHTEETKNKIREKNSKKVAMCTDDYKIIKIFNSLKEAGDWCIKQHLTVSQTPSSDICKRCKDSKKAFGYKWKYI